MLELESERWSELQHAYGFASDIPQFLSDLLSGQVDLSDAWGKLCHQYTVYSATFAAAPYLLRYAETAQLQNKVESLSLLGSIHAYKTPEEISETPDDIMEWYTHSIPLAASLATTTFQTEKLNEDDAIHLLESIAALNQCSGPDKVLSDLANDEFTVECPGCERELYVWPYDHAAGFFCASDDPVSNPDATKTDVIMSSLPNPDAKNSLAPANAYPWLYHLSHDAGYLNVSESLRSLYGTVVCPECGRKFNLMRELEKAI